MNFLDSDFERAFAPTEDLFSIFGSNIFLTGGTGFFGAWLIDSFLWQKKNRDIGGASLTILSRDPARFISRFPELASRLGSVDFIRGDICDFHFPEKKFTHIIHAATPVVANNHPSEELLKIIDQGTARVLEFAKMKGIRNLLLTSSGAVYGTQPKDLKKMPESGSVNSEPVSTYGLGKRMAEARCLKAYEEGWLDPIIARCYAFIGPYLPINAHLAVACFTQDALNASPIEITGSGDTRRSYLYGADLSAWLWNLLYRGKPAYPYNVGSEKEFSLLNVAQEFAKQVNTSVNTESSPQGGTPDRYVPSVKRCLGELGLRETFDLALSIERTLKWNRENMKHV
jgi:dTDP-glucose 4,6-dehydratase